MAINTPCIVSGKAFGLKPKTNPDGSKDYPSYLGWEFMDPSEDPRRAYLPTVNPHYKFRSELVMSVLSFLSAPHGDTLFLSGPSGSGKTSLVLQAAARLNWHVREFCGGAQEPAAMIGSYILKPNPENPSTTVMHFEHGPLVEAMKYGDIFLFNEFDCADPAQLSSLNTVMEGGLLEIPETGEVIQPHPMFRIILTGNSVGQGDTTGSYQGVVAQNLATMDRCRVLLIGYATASQETNILKAVLGVEDFIIKSMIQTANAVRKQFEQGAVSVPVTTRALIRWGHLIEEKSQSDRPVGEAFDEAVLNRVSSEDERTAIRQILKGCFPESTQL